MPLELPEDSCKCIIKSVLKSMESAPGALGATVSTFLEKIVIETIGKCPECFLGQFLPATSLNPHQKSMDNAPGIHWVESFTFFQ